MKVIRGAVCVSNTAEDISAGAVRLVEQIMKANGLFQGDVEAVFFSATRDLDACYPAAAVREKLLPQAAFMCFAEMNVAGSAQGVIRAAVFAKTEKTPVHCYLGEAAKLRPDLSR